MAEGDNKPEVTTSTRREVLTGISVLATTYAARRLPYPEIFRPKSEPVTTPSLVSVPNATSEIATTPPALGGEIEQQNEKREKQNSSRLFEDEAAQRIADELGMTVGDFISPKDTLSDEYRGFLDANELLPVFFPHVYEHKDTIYALSEKFSMPPNVIALLMSVESGGNPQAKSNANAYGLFQVVPDSHPDFAALSEEDRYDPMQNGKYGVDYFVNSCLNGARTYLDQQVKPGEDALPWRHPDVFLLAYGMYNAGVNGASKPFDEQFGQAKQYIQHANRWIRTMEIAHRLRMDGKSDEQIANALVSEEVNARAFALKDMPEDADYAAAYAFLAHDSLADPQNQFEESLKASYETYKNEPNKEKFFKYPLLNPAVRMHAAVNADFVTEDPINQVQENWKHISP